jgi:membrane protease YdiL (CAAX protease family)
MPDPPGPPAYLAWLPDFLFRTDPVRSRYVAKAWALALVPSFLIGGLLSYLFPGLEGPDFPMQVGTPLILFLLVVLSPVVETLILLPIVLLLNRFFGSGPAAVVSAALWGIAHSLQASGWGLVVWWPFLIMSIALLTWRERGLPTALAVVISIHVLQNAFAAVFLFTGAG